MQELLRTGIYFGKLEVNSPTLPSRAAAQTSLHKMYTFVYRTFIKFILFCRGQALDVPMHSRAAAQISLHKMYTFVYIAFIKFIFFCRGQALDVLVS